MKLEFELRTSRTESKRSDSDDGGKTSVFYKEMLKSNGLGMQTLEDLGDHLNSHVLMKP
jgi:hypothetical protein